MSSAAYITGRKKYNRPQAVLFADNPGRLDSGLYVPNGYEFGATVPEGTDESLIDQFIVLSDHNRGDLDFSKNRIETKKRMINGRLRSYHVADKFELSLSWSDLPSRAFKQRPDFNTDGVTDLSNEAPSRNTEGTIYTPQNAYTVDGGAGGVELLEWYENHEGSFWVYLSYDKYNNFGNDDAAYGHLAQYNQIIEMQFADFSYNVKSRGNNIDLWDISLRLEEV